jgi:hypothetical protein
MGDFKAVKTQSDLELFDLSDNIAEETSIASQHPEIVGRIRKIIETSREDPPFFTWRYSGPLAEKQSSGKAGNRKRRKK